MNILVTGASKGIGRAIAQKLATVGNIFVTARNEEALKKLDFISGYCVCDLAKEDDLTRLGNFIEETKIDVLVNNAGEYIYSPLADTKLDDLSHIIKVNLKAPIYLASCAVKNMKQNHFVELEEQITKYFQQKPLIHLHIYMNDQLKMW